MMNRIKSVRSSVFIGIAIFFINSPAFADRVNPSCKNLIETIAAAPPENFEFQHRSFTSTFLTSILMFNATQALRSTLGDTDFFTPAFRVTLPTDVLLTLTTHAINLSNIKPLKNLLDGKFLGPALEAPAKIVINGLLGVAYINASWFATGVTFTPEKVCLSAALCTVVYPTLYFVKTRLFKRLPLQRDRKRVKEFRKDPDFGEAFQTLEQDVSTAARAAKIPKDDIELLTLTYIDNLMTDWPIEEKLVSLSLRSYKIAELVVIIKSSDFLWKKRRARRNLLAELIQMAEASSTPPETKEKILNALHLGFPFTEESSFKFHKAMISRARIQRAFVWASSLLDQAISVGVAGGVGMYHVNDYAVHH